MQRMSNLHTPERGADEDRASYIERRRASKRAAKALECPPMREPLAPGLAALPGAWLRFWLGQHTRPDKTMRRALLLALGARQLRQQSPRYALARARRTGAPK